MTGGCRFYSLDYEETAKFSLDDLQQGKGWAEYIKGVAHELGVEGIKLSGWEGVIGGNVPRGAGLSSSAAVELASSTRFCVRL